jgi:hypothetical protein
MEAAEAAALLAVAAMFDNRKPDANAAHAWAAALDGMDPELCREAIVEHYRHEHRWIMPADVIKGARKLGVERAPVSAEVPAALQAMDDGPEFDAAYRRWMQTGEVPDAQKQLTA